MINRLINQLAKPGTLILLLIVGLALRLINISDGLWLDEIWSMQSSAPGNSFEQIIAYCKRDTHPPLFDLLLNLFLKLFGDTHYHGRVLALIFGIAGIALTWYYAGKISENRLVKFAAAALVCLSFFHIYYSGGGRFYSFLYLLSLLCISELYLYISRKN
ncbi:MAG: glycosyltransferase family 39 protein, partial [Luteibaculum sp.]